MSAALVDASAFDSDEAIIWQLSLWPPDRVVPAARISGRPRFLHLVEHPVVVVQAAQPVQPGTFPCTWPNCSRDTRYPFPTARQLANHRFAAHGIRSSNEESIARQARRDRRRALGAATAAPEYLDLQKIRASVQQLLPLNLGPNVRTGPLDPGEREHLRRRICYLISHDWMRELGRAPAEIAVAIGELAAQGFVPPRLLPDVNQAERMLGAILDLVEEPRAAVAAARGSRKASVA